MNNLFKNLLCEKYRPVILNDVILSEDNRRFFEELNKKQEIPNLLLFGEPGTGKTTAAKIIVNDILKCQYHYINASDKNGIDIIRNEITNFAQTKSFNGKQKVIVLDEFEATSFDAQRCLRNVMEEYASTTRFILTTNYLNKVIPAIQSRCQAIEIIPPFKEYIKRCLEIIKKEDIRVNDDNKDKIVPFLKSCYPDLRKAINNIQKFTINNELNILDIKDNTIFAKKIYDHIQEKKNLFELRKYIIEHEIDFGNDYYLLLKDLFDVVFDDDKIMVENKRDLLLIIYDFMYKYNFVMDKEINLFSCILEMSKHL